MKETVVETVEKQEVGAEDTPFLRELSDDLFRSIVIVSMKSSTTSCLPVCPSIPPYFSLTAITLSIFLVNSSTLDYKKWVQRIHRSLES
jgi:hypothetical protein